MVAALQADREAESEGAAKDRAAAMSEAHPHPANISGMLRKLADEIEAGPWQGGGSQ